MFKTLSEKVVHKNPWYKIIQRKYQISKNKTGDYFIMEGSDSSIVIPIKGEKIIFIKNFRIPTGKWSLELPCGITEKGSNKKETALRELEEETGYKAKKIKKIGMSYPIPGRSRKGNYIFIAQDLKYVGQKTEETEAIKVIELTKEEAFKLVSQGKITDGLTLSALAIARDLLLKK